MSKFERFMGHACHGGYSKAPSVPEADRLNLLLVEFKSWFASMDGFGAYLTGFFHAYQAYFDEYVNEHKLLYTQLHKEFSDNLETSIDSWLHANGLTEDDFGEMLQLARTRSDQKSDEIFGVLFAMLDYQSWITQISALKQSNYLADVLAALPTEQTCPHPPKPQMLTVEVPPGTAAGQELHVTSPDGQVLSVTVPEGLVSGQQFMLTYLPLAEQDTANEQ
mmetsp:Transcript_111766/g.216543  ORF Transcript_111766/g.216543 Transcript_111766/m.216543 type:complete len:221 (-) Transcript_111766:122-784(-)|eukprot:CAMPEP_0172712336 /NCGR_PEP_ID=MMETSP1074-20121228/61039_1 /TAXON_ID=2916 /ORGANISM="Ceratium fusus, Strain PA161109" /LENGTH=220 /DNA_ID=CAMNT_0013536247 /DNA_START=45 /DNA_END=707 /DNA_ORIENTATION=+